MGCRATRKSRRWNIVQLKCRATRLSRRWDIAQLKCRASEKSRKWYVAQLKCCADGISRKKCRANDVNPTNDSGRDFKFQYRNDKWNKRAITNGKSNYYFLLNNSNNQTLKIQQKISTGIFFKKARGTPRFFFHFFALFFWWDLHILTIRSVWGTQNGYNRCLLLNLSILNGPGGGQFAVERLEGEK